MAKSSINKEGKKKSKRGFAAMPQEQRSAIARKGGLAVKAENRAFARDPALAQRAGRKGGKAVSSEDRAFYVDRALAIRAGRKGGEARARGAGGGE